MKRKIFNDKIIDAIIYYIVKNISTILTVISICISFSIGTWISYWLFIDAKVGGADYAVVFLMSSVLVGFVILLFFVFIDAEGAILDNVKWLFKSKYESCDEKDI